MTDDPKTNPNRGSRYKAGNTASDGSYIVGKGRPPKRTQFAKGDGRKRGRRPKGQKNFDTLFMEEANRKVTIVEGGKKRKVTKLHSVIIRGFDNAGAKGQNTAIAQFMGHAQRISDSQRPSDGQLEPDEEAMLNAWIEQAMAKIAAGDNPGDPETAPQSPRDGLAGDASGTS